MPRHVISRQFLWLSGLLISLVLLAGCNQQATSTASPKAGTKKERKLSPSVAARRALQQNDLPKAHRLVEKALLESPEEPAVLGLAAEIAYASGDKLRAAELMIEAARLDDYANEGLVQECASQLLAIGRLFETIEFLDKVLKKQPNHINTRRNLVYFLFNTELHAQARHHCRIMIGEREFDKSMLFWMVTQEQRDIPPNTMNEFFRLNPSDQRLQIAKLRILLDNGQWDEFQVLGEKLIESNPEFVPAQLLFGQYLAQTSQFDRLSEWSAKVPEPTRQHWQYWEAIGDAALHFGQHQQAARAYFEASRRDLNVASVAVKLTRALRLCNQTSTNESKNEKIVRRRAELLTRFLQEKESFHKNKRKSNAILCQMATTLEQLGRLWEAEAWTAVGLAEPDEDAERLQNIRKRITSKLRQDSPWQMTTGQPYTSLDLTALPLPKLADAQELKSNSADSVEIDIAPSVIPKLIQQASVRGLVDKAKKPVTVGDGVIPLYAQLGFGGATLDFDLDGWPDVYVASCGTEPLSDGNGNGNLFRNHAGNFSAVKNSSGIRDRGFAQGVAAGDLNEDGFTDLVLLNYGFDQIYLNNGDGTFAEQKTWIDDAPSDWSTSGAVADIDLDGISDFICLKYCVPRDPIHRRCTAGASGTIDYCMPANFDAAIDQFYRGRPDGGWNRANENWNSIPNNPGRGLGLIVGQLNNRSKMGIFVSNDMTSNHLWNVTTGTGFQLREEAIVSGLALDSRSQPQASMGIAAADLDGDGDTDFFVTNFENEHNTLYQQSATGIWEDKSHTSDIFDVSFPALGFGTQAVDLDNDSHLEIVVANGHVHHDGQPGYSQQPHVFRRASNGAYEVVSADELSEYFRSKHVGRALWFMDFDRDHRLDLVVTHQSEPTALLHNQTKAAIENRWLRLNLVGTKSARIPVGATVSVSCGELIQTRQLLAGDGYFCTNEKTLHFGLGQPSDDEAEISVRWPNGNKQNYRSKVNQECLLVEGDNALVVLH